jgi:hypothetical protein
MGESKHQQHLEVWFVNPQLDGCPDLRNAYNPRKLDEFFQFQSRGQPTSVHLASHPWRCHPGPEPRPDGYLNGYTTLTAQQMLLWPFDATLATGRKPQRGGGIGCGEREPCLAKTQPAKVSSFTDIILMSLPSGPLLRSHSPGTGWPTGCCRVFSANVGWMGDQRCCRGHGRVSV